MQNTQQPTSATFQFVLAFCTFISFFPLIIGLYVFYQLPSMFATAFPLMVGSYLFMIPILVQMAYRVGRMKQLEVQTQQQLQLIKITQNTQP